MISVTRLVDLAISLCICILKQVPQLMRYYSEIWHMFFFPEKNALLLESTLSDNYSI